MAQAIECLHAHRPMKQLQSIDNYPSEKANILFNINQSIVGYGVRIYP
jgi:hypothetical protein